jgi:hypothetical protein
MDVDISLERHFLTLTWKPTNMQFTDQVTPATILTELVHYGHAQPEETQGFCDLKQDDLHSRFCTKAERIFAAFDKYQPVTYEFWRAGDRGTDIAMRYSGETISGGTDRYIGMRITSYDEFEKGGDLAARIKVQIHELEKDYEALLDRYYLLFCTDDRKHPERVEAIRAKLDTDSTIVLVEPGQAWSFFSMEDAVIDAVVDRLMYSEDYVRRQAREQVAGIGKRKLVLLLSCLIHSIEENGCFAVPDDFLMHNDHVQEFEKNNPEDNGSLSEDLVAMEGRFFFREADVDGFEIYQDSVAAIVALYYDAKVRYGHTGDEAVRYLYTFLEQSA